jgi:hypothetical protein
MWAIFRFLIGPAAFPKMAQSAGMHWIGIPRFLAHLSPSLSAPEQPPDITQEMGNESKKTQSSMVSL